VDTFPEEPRLALSVARCESGLKADARHVNTNGTVDVSIFQINSIHNGTMKEMGLVPTDVRHNIKFARYLYDKSGGTFNDWVCYTRKMVAMI